jgi:hypothetical protein
LKKYSKNSKKYTKLQQVVPGSVGGLNKKLGAKKKKTFVECQKMALGKGMSLPSAWLCTWQRGVFFFLKKTWT